MSSSDTRGSETTLVTSPAERRRNLRFPFTATVECTELSSGATLTGRTNDLGLGGCYVDTIGPFPVGTEIKIRIIRENETFEVQAKVVSSQLGMGMGVAFVSAQPKQIQVFQRWMLEISGKSVPLPESEKPEPAPAAQSQTFNNAVLSGLILTLMKKNVLTETEGKELLRKLFE
jgi:hypothetical protein